MSYVHPGYLAHQAKRWQRHDWRRWLRHDWERFMLPDWRNPKNWEGGVVPAHLLELADGNRRKPARENSAEQEAIERQRLELRYELAKLRTKLELLKFELGDRRRCRACLPGIPMAGSGRAARERTEVVRSACVSRMRAATIRACSRTRRPMIRPNPGRSTRRTRRKDVIQLTCRRKNPVAATPCGTMSAKAMENFLPAFVVIAAKLESINMPGPVMALFSPLSRPTILSNRTLERNQELVDRVASGQSSKEFINARFGYRTGREAFRSTIDSEPYLRDTYEVGVDIRHDPRATKGYRVNTAYPRNSHPR
jgi:hypothetical protein